MLVRPGLLEIAKTPRWPRCRRQTVAFFFLFRFLVDPGSTDEDRYDLRVLLCAALEVDLLRPLRLEHLPAEQLDRAAALPHQQTGEGDEDDDGQADGDVGSG
ncbi:hypothetical protein DL768_007422 [Monosporascus sp. mg162]|nr:hypothetical protein DL768_007422 [Monosporascus sp. mg162]